MPVKTSNKREGLSKTIRFEVFKRDKFTCQYCGGKAPDILLHVDHIEPVAKGGTNEIANLITSCQSCNSGKSDKQLSDNSVIEKQRKQLELLQERREQIELMFEWKKSLSKLDNETVEMVKEYADAKIQPFSISENGTGIILTLLRKYSINEVLDAIDVSSATYLKFSEGKPTQESAEKFLDKLGGILFNRSLKPVDQKLAQIKNKAKNGLSYYNARSGAILLTQYISALRQYWKYTDEQIIQDLENELAPKLDGTRNWSEWSNQIEAWIEAIKKPKEEEVKEKHDEEVENLPQGEIAEMLGDRKKELESTIKVLVYILKPYPNFEEARFKHAIYNSLISIIQETDQLADEQLLEYEKKGIFGNDFLWKFVPREELLHFEAGFDRTDKNHDLVLLDKLSLISSNLLDKLFDQFYYSPLMYSKNDLQILRTLSLECLNNWKTA